jgi:hypothetical protein
MRTWMIWALSAVLALTWAAAAPADPPASPPPDKNADLATQLHNLTTELAGLRREIELLRRDLTDAAARGARTSVDVRDLQQRLDAVQNTVNRQDDAVRRALSINPQTPPTAPSTGTIVLRNRSGVNGTFVINGRAYSVAAGGSMRVEGVPAGTFTYEIDADFFGLLRPLTTRVLSAGQTFYLNIDPQS